MNIRDNELARSMEALRAKRDALRQIQEAAPDLLAALKVALDDIEHLSRAAREMGWTTDNEEATVRRGRAAIAKAIG